MLCDKAFWIGLALAAVAGGAVAQPGGVNAGLPPVMPMPKVVPVEPGATPPTPGAPPAAEGPAMTCAPAQLFRATIRNVSPGLQAGDPRAQPRQIWRKGNVYLRTVEQPMPPNGDQQVTIIAEPDIWLYNEATRTAQHTLDPGPVFEVHAPILPLAADLAPIFRTLEFGCEMDFLAQHGARAERTLNWGGTPAGLYTVTSGDQSVVVLADEKRREPVMLSFLRQGRPLFVLRYDDYQHGLPDRPQLFAPPPSARVVPAPAQPQQPGAPPALSPAPGSRAF